MKFSIRKEMNPMKKPQPSGKLVLVLSTIRFQGHPNTQRTIPTNDKKWIFIQAHLPDGHIALAASIYKNVAS